MSYPPPPPGTPEDNPYAQQPHQTPAPQYFQPYGMYTTPAPMGGNNGLAIGAMVTGIASIVLACCCWPLGFVAGGTGAVLGFVSQNQIKQQGQSNRGMAIAGIATGAAGVVLSIANIILTVVFQSRYGFNNFNFN